jgi:hypothetical protein
MFCDYQKMHQLPGALATYTTIHSSLRETDSGSRLENESRIDTGEQVVFSNLIQPESDN